MDPITGNGTAPIRVLKRRRHRLAEVAVLITAIGGAIGAISAWKWWPDDGPPETKPAPFVSFSDLEPRVRAVENAQAAQASSIAAIREEQKELHEDVREMARDTDTKLDRVLTAVQRRHP